MKTEFVPTSFGKFAYEDNGSGAVTYLMLHGGASNLRAWDGVVSNLKDSNRCVAVDLPGHGKTIVEPFGFRDLASALVEICNVLRVDKPILIGHSFGALVAAITALHYPALFTGVMAVDPYLDSKEVKRKYRTLNDALNEIGNMTWPWRVTSDIDAEVDRCMEENYSPRKNSKSLRAMIHRGFRLQADGSYIRYPRREEEMNGVEANWSIDIGETFKAIESPLSIAVSIDSIWRLEKRRMNLEEFAAVVRNFESIEFECKHDIPGYLPDELSDYIVSWTQRIAQRNITMT